MRATVADLEQQEGHIERACNGAGLRSSRCGTRPDHDQEVAREEPGGELRRERDGGGWYRVAPVDRGEAEGGGAESAAMVSEVAHA